ncbi:sialidase family protein [Tautonia sociabilis]|uniref:Neuraminidase (Sialidase)-like protein n=1 Tax=Tautonia sociabilis TaxID=2080755 RepID=A0A432MML2_9BACT|nr:exo-alpha-sialidase [Tautonia sociabilis]RUL88437.1 neuraminidase (sialidase)-like protein [Tautonia sociabilis]
MTRATLLLLAPLAFCLSAKGDGLEIREIFPPEAKHNHASCLVECPDGSLLIAWYRGSGERKADDVQIFGARLPEGADCWGPRFLLADTPGYPDCNPALFVPPDGSLWLFYPTILDHRWEGALLKYRVAKRSAGEGAPDWDRDGVLHVTPERFAEAYREAASEAEQRLREANPELVALMAERSEDELYQRLGWMPRVRPIVLPTGRWLLPLYSDTFSASIVALSDDRGESWRCGAPMIGFGNIQPSLVRRDDGTIVAFMRDNGPGKAICVSSSSDDGESWSPVTRSILPNPGAGVDAIRLRSGRWALAYNDLTDGRYSLAVALSDDEGTTWPVVRRIAFDPEQTQSFHYPSILQTRDGAIHVSFTHGGRPEGSTISHARMTEEWLRLGEEERPAP